MLRSVLENHYGNIASVLGLVFTIVTMIKAQGAKRAAEEASRAAREAVLRISSQLMTTEIETSLQLIRATADLCHGSQWEAAILRIDEALNRLSRLVNRTELDQIDQGTLIAVCGDIGVIMPLLEKLRATPKGTKVPLKVGSTLHGIKVDLGRIKGGLESRMLEV